MFAKIRILTSRKQTRHITCKFVISCAALIPHLAMVLSRDLAIGVPQIAGSNELAVVSQNSTKRLDRD
jgi:hypothetical protein